MSAEIRCRHDMVDGTCAICRGLPDVPLLDDLFVEHHGGQRGVTVPVDEWHERGAGDGRCASCGCEITDNTAVAAWSPDDAGLVGSCCAG